MATIERTKNAGRNMFFGIILKAYQIVIPFVMRTIMIYFMGVQYLGLNSLFVSILQVLNLAELGVGSAMVYSMYRPIVEDDSIRINALMRLYRTYYRVIGLIVAAAGIMILPILPKLIKSDVPDNINIYVLYLLNLGTTVMSYWLFAYKNSLLQAHQRTDIVSKVTLGTGTFQYLTQILVIIFLKDYYVYIIVQLFTQVLTNIVTAIVTTKIYPNYKPIGKLPDEEVKNINKRIRDLFTAKLGGVIVNSADTIVISAFLGLTILAIYQNYYFIMSSVIGFVAIIFQSSMAGIGNSIIVETKEKNFKDFSKFVFLITWIATFCTCCFLCLYQPFMGIWIGEDLKMAYSIVVCMCIYYFIHELNQLLNVYKDAAGMWHEDRFRPLVTALANLGMNLVMVQFWGLYGVVLSTVISTLFIGMPWLIHNLFTTIFTKDMFPTFGKNVFMYVVVSIVTCVISVVLGNFINGSDWFVLIIRLIICAIVPNGIYWLVFHKKIEFIESMKLINKMTKNKIPYINRFK